MVKNIKNKAGMTIIELLVALAILGIISIGMSVFFSYIWKNRFKEINVGQATFGASQGVSSMAKNIRKAAQGDNGAFMIKKADDLEFQFYSDVSANGHRERVYYYLDEGGISMGTAEAILGDNPIYPAEDDFEIRVIAKNVTNDETNPLFIFYDSNGNALETPVSELSIIKKVRVSVLVNVDPGKMKDVKLEALVALRNAIK